jgi:hypothetical protein
MLLLRCDHSLPAMTVKFIIRYPSVDDVSARSMAGVVGDKPTITQRVVSP